MAGRVIRVVPKTFVSFSPSQATALTTPQVFTQILARRVDVSQWREVTLFARLHTPSVVGAMSGLPTIVAWADGFTDEDPSPAAAANGTFGTPNSIFLKSLTLSNNAFVANAATAVQMLVVALPSNIGGLISVGVTATQAATTVQCDMYLSIDLSGKE